MSGGEGPDHRRGPGASWPDDDHSCAGNTRRAPFPFALATRPGCVAVGRCRLPGRVQGPVPAALGLGPDGVLDLVRRPRPRGPRRGSGGSGTVRVLDAGDPRLQAVDGVAAGQRGRRVLPHRRHRRPPGPFPRRAPAPSTGTPGVTHSRANPPAVRGPAHRRPRLTPPLRLRPDRSPRTARPTDLRSLPTRHHRPARGTRPPRPARARQGRADHPGAAPTGGRTGRRPRHRRPGARADPAQPVPGVDMLQQPITPCTCSFGAHIDDSPNFDRRNSPWRSRRVSG
jgi:hypothetical protein